MPTRLLLVLPPSFPLLHTTMQTLGVGSLSLSFLPLEAHLSSSSPPPLTLVANWHSSATDGSVWVTEISLLSPLHSSLFLLFLPWSTAQAGVPADWKKQRKKWWRVAYLQRRGREKKEGRKERPSFLPTSPHHLWEPTSFPLQKGSSYYI